MTTPYIEKYLTGYKGIKNLGSDSYSVLLELLDANPEETLEADIDFANRMVAFANRPNNIWAKNNGVYLITDPETENVRATKIAQIAQKLGFDEKKVDSLITRIYSALIRHMRKRSGFNDAIENSRERLEKVAEEIESEA